MFRPKNTTSSRSKIQALRTWGLSKSQGGLQGSFFRCVAMISLNKFERPLENKTTALLRDVDPSMHQMLCLFVEATLCVQKNLDGLFRLLERPLLCKEFFQTRRQNSSSRYEFQLSDELLMFLLHAETDASGTTHEREKAGFAQFLLEVHELQNPE